MHALIIGYGSIGSRHAKILQGLGINVGILTHQKLDEYKTFSEIEDALREWDPSYIVVANKTHNHATVIRQLIQNKFTGKVLVEKPLFETLYPKIHHHFSLCAVAYNLRFHPLIQKLRNILTEEKVLSFSVYVGQYLPHWRKGVDYRTSYSSKMNEGGGVLRDLSHELDYVNWILPGWKKLVALGGHFSALEIDSDDLMNILIVSEKCPSINVQLNYLERTQRRQVLVNTNSKSLFIDLVQGSFEIDGNKSFEKIDKEKMYTDQHRAMLKGDSSTLCSYQEGVDVLNMIQAIERSIVEERWIEKK